MGVKEDYENRVRASFTYIKATQSQNISVFSASPVRIREQKEFQYYEVGASNITDSGAIIVNQNDKLKKSANETSFNRQYLRVGDVVVAFRATPRFGVIVETPEVELVPNTSMIVIRTNSAISGANLCTYLNQPHVYSYLKYLISMENKKILTVETLEQLLIPDLDYYDSDYSLLTMLKIQTSYRDIEKFTKSLFFP
jgi:hypothetical protein